MPRTVPLPTADQTRRIVRLVRKAAPLPCAAVLARVEPKTAAEWMRPRKKGQTLDPAVERFQTAVRNADREVLESLLAALAKEGRRPGRSAGGRVPGAIPRSAP